MWKYGVLVSINCLALSISYHSKRSHFSLSRGKSFWIAKHPFWRKSSLWPILTLLQMLWDLFSKCLIWGSSQTMLLLALIELFFLFSYSVILGLWWPQRKVVWQLLWRMASLLPISKIFTLKGWLLCKALQCHTKHPASFQIIEQILGSRSCSLLQD